MTSQELLKNAQPLEVSAEELRLSLGDVLNQVRYTDRVVVVKKYNTETAIIISPRMLQRIIESGTATLESREASLKRLDELLSRVPKDIDPDELQQVIDAEVKVVRAEKRRKRSQ